MNKKVFFDQFGRRSDCALFGAFARSTYQVDEVSENLIYLRFDSTNPCAVYKISKASTVTTREVAWGNWADRAALVYSPCNSTIEVEE